MKRLLYATLLAALHALAYLPFWAIYALADCLYFLMYYVARYRRRVVMINLASSFPEKSEAELKAIAKKFYRNFADYVLETVKVLHISDAEMKRRMVFEGVEMVDDLLSQGKSIAAYFSHCFNWEWAPSVTLWTKLRVDEQAAFCQVYRPLRDKCIDALMLKLRSRFHPRSYAKQHVLRYLLTLRRDGMPSITGFMSDQKPSHGDPTYVTTFLNHPTAMITGTETLARRLGMAAIYWDMEKPSRGHYKITCRLIGEDLSDLPPMEVTRQYTQMLEATIRRDPAIWLWTHKRWKMPVEGVCTNYSC